MREILFRVKDELCGWIYGFPMIAEKLDVMYFYTEEKNNTFKPHICFTKTLGQYTGLTDKNGIKIFEGDIVKCSGRCRNNLLNKWENIIVANLDNFLEMSDLDEIYSKKVIGNIYDNPELVKECEK